MILPPQLILVFFNFLNVWLDWYKIDILKGNVAHGLNFSMYAIVTGCCVWQYHMQPWVAVFYCLSAFLDRQITFDIPLNMRRSKGAFYQSAEHKAVMDAIEYRLFGAASGKQLAIIYASLWAITLTVQLIIDGRLSGSL